MTSPTERPDMSDHEPTEPTVTPEPAATTDAGRTDEPADTADTSDGAAETEAAETVETETVETTEAVETTKSASTEPAERVWWEWFGRRRRALLVVAGVLVVGLVATFVVTSISAPGPEDVVEDYLNAIRAGDTDAALEIVGKPNPRNRLDFVTTDAMADGWTVDAAVVRNLRESDNADDEADVDVTISTKKDSMQGRFHVVQRDDEWKIDSPFVEVRMTLTGMDSVTLGRVTRKVPPPDPTRGSTSALLFPGVYRVESAEGRMSLSPNEFIAAPRPDDETLQDYVPTMELTDSGAEEAQRAVDAYVDACAKRTVAAPAGCPFSADDVVGGWTEVKTVAWRITAHPQAVLEPSDRYGFALITRKPGTVQLTGTGVEEEPPAKHFTATCEFALGDAAYANLSIDMSAKELTVITGRDMSIIADLGTRCH